GHSSGFPLYLPWSEQRWALLAHMPCSSIDGASGKASRQTHAARRYSPLASSSIARSAFWA
ncbi:TPA: hypothetical protein ACJS4R_002287, partial [Yersinia enterocolitica]